MTTVHKLDIYSYSAKYIIETRHTFGFNESETYDLKNKFLNLEFRSYCNVINDEIITLIRKTISGIQFRNIRFTNFNFSSYSLILENLNLTNLTSCFVKINSVQAVKLVNEIIKFCPYLGNLTLRGFGYNQNQKNTCNKELTEMFDNIIEKTHLWNFNFDVNIISDAYLKCTYLEKFFLELDVIPNFYTELTFNSEMNNDFIIKMLKNVSEDFSKYISKRWIIPFAFFSSYEMYYECEIEFTFFHSEKCRGLGEADEYGFGIDIMNKAYELPFIMTDHCVLIGFIKIVVSFI